MGKDCETMNWPEDFINKIVISDCLEAMRQIPDDVIQTCITSPPYWGLRDYGEEGQLGLEATPEEYVAKMVEVFTEVRRILKDDGTLWLNLGDSYAGGGRGAYCDDNSKQSTNSGSLSDALKSNEYKFPPGLKPKDIVGIPWRVAFALQKDGWYLRSDIIWHKPNPMPESVNDRPTKAHEYLFLLANSGRYFYNAAAISESTVTCDNSTRDRDNTKLNNTPGRTKMGGLIVNNYETRNKRSVWTINTKPYPGAHFATFPPDLINPCILAGSKPGDIVLDPFGGSGTTAQRAKAYGRKYIHIDLGYADLAEDRLRQEELFK